MEQEKRHSLEVVYQIWDDRHGDRIEVGPDRDALDLIEIRTYDADSKREREITMSKEQAVLLCDALTKLLEQ